METLLRRRWFVLISFNVDPLQTHVEFPLAEKETLTCAVSSCVNKENEQYGIP